MSDEYRCTCGHAVYSHSTRDDTSHCLAIDCECYAYQADSYAAGVSAERARVVEIIKAESDELLEMAKAALAEGDKEGLSLLKADMGGLYLLLRKVAQP